MSFWSALLKLLKIRVPSPAPPEPPPVQRWTESLSVWGVPDDATLEPYLQVDDGSVYYGHRDGHRVTFFVVSPPTHAGWGAVLSVGANGYQRLHSRVTLGSGDHELPAVTLQPIAPDWATGDRLLDVRGNFCNLWDDQGRIVYTPALSGALDAGCFDDWMRIQREAGSTHVFVGPFDGGPAYPGVPFSNPNLLANPARLRDFIERILNTPSADGLGFRPVIFLDGGGPNPRERIDRDWPQIFAALDGLQAHVILVPAWEPVVGDWRSSDVSYALQAIPDGWIIGYHGSPERLVGSSNPLEPDDPWHGGEADFYLSHGGERIQVAFYQTRHGREIYRDCDETQDACWLNRWEDYVARIGAGINGWRVLRLVAFETVAYEAFRGQATSDDARDVATRMQRIADKWGVRIGFGNGVPR